MNEVKRLKIKLSFGYATEDDFEVEIHVTRLTAETITSQILKILASTEMIEEEVKEPNK